MTTLKACLNGDRRQSQHPAVPVTPDELAAEAAAAQAAGATVVHLHPRAANGTESLDWSDIQPAIAAVRARCPGLVVGVSTRQEIQPDLETRRALLAAWSGPPEGPGLASVNWHEEGAEVIAATLAECGVGIEAGLFTADAARKLASTGLPDGLVRILVEAIPGVSPGNDGIEAARAILAELPGLQSGVDVVVHGEAQWAWPVLPWAHDSGFGIRAGFEDMLTGALGEEVHSNADLIRDARLLTRWQLPRS